MIERRAVSLSDVELREAEGRLTFRGYAAVFNTPTDLGYYREQIAPGAFTKTLNDGADVRFLFNHDPDSVMARTTTGSLRLSQDERGLMVEADLDPEDRDVQRLAPKLRSGNVSQMSFAFVPVKREMDEESEPPTVTLREVKLFDVSPVTFPAYPTTTAELRDAREAVSRYARTLGIDIDFSSDQEERSTEPAEEPQHIEEEPADATPSPSVPLALRKRQLELKRRQLAS